jgi:predicted O-methyltransferase YrrM
MDDRIEAVFGLYAERMAAEGALWARARQDGTRIDRDDMLLAVGPETGGLLNLLAKSHGARNILEVGTSYGYSTVWLAEAARATGGKVTTLDVAPAKQAYARDMLTKAGLIDYVEFRTGDARALIPGVGDGIDLVLLDLWKDLYVPCLELFFPKMSPGGLIVADNMTTPAEAQPEARTYRKAVRAKAGVSSVLLAVGSGIELSRVANEVD